MNPFMRFRRLVLSLVILLAVGAVLRVNSVEPLSPAPSSSLIDWGNPDATFGDYFIPDVQSFIAEAFKFGGTWIRVSDGTTGWSVSPAEAGFAALEIDLNLTSRTNDLNMRTGFYDATGAALYVDLLDEDGHVVATNVAGNLLSGSGAGKQSDVTLPLAAHPGTAMIQLRCDYGGVIVYSTELSLKQAGAADAGRALGDASAGTMTSAGNAGDLAMVNDGSNSQAVATGAQNGSNTNAATENALPFLAHSGGKVVYVDAHTGSDRNSGRVSPSAALIIKARLASAGARLTKNAGTMTLASSNTVAGALGQRPSGDLSSVTNSLTEDGPKATIAAGLREAMPDDTLVIYSGSYHESLNLAGRKGTVRIEGSVNLSGTGQGHRPDAVLDIAADAQGAGTNGVQQVNVIKGETHEEQ